MDTTTKWVIGIIIIVILGFGAWALWGHGGSTPAATTGSETGTTTNPSDTGTTSQSDMGMDSSGERPDTTVVVTYTDSGFSPATLNVTVGQTVTFLNHSSGQMWVASNPHPVHTGYDGTTEQVHCAPGYAGPAPFDECSTANTFTFTFTKAGSWGYHNHFNESAHGIVVVAPSAGSSN